MSTTAIHDDPQWFTNLRSTPAFQDSACTIDSEKHEARFTWRPHPDAVNFSAVDPEWTLFLTRNGRSTHTREDPDLRIARVPEGAHIIIEADSEGAGSVYAIDGLVTSLQVDIPKAISRSAPMLGIQLDSADVVVVSRHQRVRIQPAKPNGAMRVAKLCLEDAQVMLSPGVESLILRGECGYKPNDGARFPLKVTAHRDATLVAPDGEGALPDTESIAFAETDSQIFIGSAERPTSLGVRSISGGRIDIRTGSTLSLLKDATDYKISGLGRVVVAPQATLTTGKIECADLDIGEQAQLTAITGRTGRLVQARACHITSLREEGFWVEDVARPPQPDAQSAVAGSSFEYVRIPVSPRGCQILLEFETLSQFTPGVQDLPTVTRRVAIADLFRKRKRVAVSSDRAIQTQYTRLLSRLANTKGSPASERTRVVWAAYCMRTSTAQTRSERALLTAYRMLGYGERPGPPLVTWLATAMILAPTGPRRGPMLDPSLELTRRLLHNWCDYLLSPLHLLNLAGGVSAPGPFLTVTRTLVAIPFVTAVLAIRRFVKADPESGP